MLFKNVLLSSLATAATCVFAEDAPVVKGSTPDFFQARIEPHTGPLSGGLKIAPGPNGEGVRVELSFNHFRNSSEIFYYHIHEHPVPANGSCKATGGHLNPYNGTMPCNPAEAASCQIGDLSGKHGTLKKDTEKQTYYDKYLSTSHTDAAYVGGRSLVVHDAKMTPVACASLIKTKGTDDPVSIGVAKTPLN